jgi:hypothetical protein
MSRREHCDVWSDGSLGRLGELLGTGDIDSRVPALVKQAGHLGPTQRGIDGALLDLEYERIELIKFNLFDNNGTYKDYVLGRNGIGGPALKIWKEFRLPPGTVAGMDA